MINNSLKKNAYFSIIHRTVNIIFPLISTAYVSRVLLADGIGRVSAVNNNVSLFLILSTLGIPAYGLREVSKYRDNKEKCSKIYSELFLINCMLTVIICLIFVFVVLESEYFQKESILYFIYGLTILMNTFNVEWLFQGMEDYEYIATRSTIVKIFSLAFVIALIKDKNDIYIYAIIQVIGTTANYILNIINAKKYIKFTANKLNFKKHFKPLIYLALCSVSTELYAKMDITMLDIMKTSDIVGCYANSQKIVNLVVTLLVAVTAVFMPRLSFLFDKNQDAFSEVVQKGFNLMVTISIPICIGLIMISRPLVVVFLGLDFINADLFVSILSLMVPLKCVGDLICYQVMMCVGKEVILMKSYFITMIINLINNIVLIPRFSAVGAAVASVVSEVLAFLFVLHFSHKYFRLTKIKQIFSKTLICSILMCCVVFPLRFLSCSYCVKLIVEICLGMIVYFSSCIFVKHEVVLEYCKYIKRIKK